MKKLIFLFLFTLFSFHSYAYEAAVVSANPQASRAGIEILKKGGSAADAAIATAFALTVVEPYNSGIGGGGLLVYYDATTKEFSYLDYREIAPLGADYYQQRPEKLEKGVLSIGVPGFVKGMETISKKWGKLSWNEVLAPSIRLAEGGVPLKGKLKDKIKEFSDRLAADPSLSEIYLKPYQEHQSRISQKELALTLRGIQEKGAKIFYRGALGRKIVSFIEEKGGILASGDLASYQIYFRKPYQFTKGPYQITSAHIPSSGGAGLDLLFKKATVYKIKAQFPYSPYAYRLLINAMKDYFDYRESALGDSSYNVISHTTHISIIDADGNMAAMTNTLNSSFGAGMAVPETGIILNDELGDFSKNPNSANRARGGRRPLSSMAPTLIFKNQEPYLIIGTSGGTTIPQNLFQVLFFSWDWASSLRQAIHQPKIYYSENGSKVLVESRVPRRVRKSLQNQFRVEELPSIGNIQALLIQSPTETMPLSDPRGEGKGLTYR